MIDNLSHIKFGGVFPMETSISEKLASQGGNRLKFSAKLSYGLGDLASNLCWTMVTTYLLFFYTDVAKLDLAAISLLFIVARLWDAINDPIMGYLADRTHSRWGRFRPYLLFGPAALALSMFLCFSVPELSAGWKLAYAYATYILLGMSYTLVNMPYGALAASMTQNADERSSLSGFRMFFAIVGAVVVSSAVQPLVRAFGGSDFSSVGFSKTALIFAAAILPLYFLVFSGTREIVQPRQSKKIPLKTLCRAVFGNRPLVIILISTLIASTCLFIRQSMLVYYCTYVMGNAAMASALLALMTGMLVVGVVTAAPLSKKIGSKKATMMIGLIVSGLCCLGMYLTGPEQTTFLYVWIVIGSAFSGLTYVMIWSMVADTIEYGEWKTGARADGVIYSVASFVQKLATALSGWGAAMLLAVSGYVANASQTPQALSAINLSMTILPGAALLLAAIPLLFHKLNRNEYNRILEELQRLKIADDER